MDDTHHKCSRFYAYFQHFGASVVNANISSAQLLHACYTTSTKYTHDYFCWAIHSDRVLILPIHAATHVFLVASICPLVVHHKRQHHQAPIDYLTKYIYRCIHTYTIYAIYILIYVATHVSRYFPLVSPLAKTIN